MSTPNPLSIAAHFESLPDPRISRKTEHKLLDIIVIAISAVICHAAGYRLTSLAGPRRRGFGSF